jgi:hypothetical protein
MTDTSANTSHKSVLGLLPLDARPICYEWPQTFAAIGQWPLLVPPLSLWKPQGSIKTPIAFDSLLTWLHTTNATCPPAAWVWSVDAVAFGGLIPARVCAEPLDTLQDRVQKVLAAMGTVSGYAFASILRIPDYNNAEEEPDYWASYGQALYNYSVRRAQGLRLITKELPDTVVNDFLSRRERHFDLNQWLVTQLGKTPALSWLAFCQDDTGPIGLNVTEANTLKALLSGNDVSDDNHLAEKGMVQTGADELMTCLMVRHWLTTAATPPGVGVRAGVRAEVRVWVHYGDAACADVIMPFDGLPLATVVTNKLALCGAVEATTPDTADVLWVIHGASNTTGDWMAHTPASQTATSLEGVKQAVIWAKNTGKPVVVGDVAYANGGDPDLTHWLIREGHWQGLAGYAAWNTPGNALGCSLSMGLAYWLAQQQQCLDHKTLTWALQQRLLEDGVYQGILRPQGQHGQVERSLAWLLPILTPWVTALGIATEDLTVSWPCNRWFEISITLN